MYADEDLIPISALQHHLFCPRQCALIHVDGLWAENRLTAEGRVLHERSDTPGRRTKWRAGDSGGDAPSAGAGAASGLRDTGGRAVHSGSRVGVRTVRAMPLISRRLGLAGKADQVELPVDGDGRLVGPPRPVEHKRGRPKRLDHDRVQLAAQAMCLEEMFGLAVAEADLFYNAVRHRERVAIDDRLRELVRRIAGEVRGNIVSNTTPPARKQRKCASCSLLHLCLPGGTGPDRSPKLYVSRALRGSLRDDIGGEDRENVIEGEGEGGPR